MQRGDAAEVAVGRYGEDGCADIILRCRVLRSLKRELALGLIGSMTQAVECAFNDLDPDLVLTFTMDRYVMDVMSRMAVARGVDFLEGCRRRLCPGEVMSNAPGTPHRTAGTIRSDDVEAAVTVWFGEAEFSADPMCVTQSDYSMAQDFWRILWLLYVARERFFLTRLAFSQARDRYNIHYMDALKQTEAQGVGMRDVAVLNFARAGIGTAGLPMRRASVGSFSDCSFYRRRRSTTG